MLRSSLNEFWEKEHVNPDMLPQISIERPSSSIEMFLKFLKKNNLPIDGASVLSLGSGKGRNEIYMAKHGFNVVGIDYIDMAVKEAKKILKNKKGNFSFASVSSAGHVVPWEKPKEVSHLIDNFLQQI